MSGFASRMQARAGENIFLVTGGADSTGKDAWYFVQVESSKIQAFLRAIKSGAMDLVKFGEILKSGYGASPSQTIIDEMKEHHGYKG